MNANAAEISDSDLEDIANASKERIGAPAPREPSRPNDLLQTIGRARDAWVRRGEPTDTSDVLRRHVALREITDTLPLGARTATREELEARIHPRALRAAQGWRWGSGNLVLMGATGTGKTSAAAHLVRRLCHEAAVHGGAAYELAEIIRWQSCRALSGLANETKRGTGTPEAVTRCQYARLLVLNDLGAGDERETLERILDERYERGWPTITTTGLGRVQLEQAFGDALSRRIFECKGNPGAFVELARVG